MWKPELPCSRPQPQSSYPGGLVGGLAIRSRYGVEAALAALAVFCSVCTPLNAGPGRDERRPNIIFLITDDQLPRTFNFLPAGKGNNLTPNLDRLAAEGTILMGQHVSSSVCTPSRFSCLTGTYASRATNPGFVRKFARDPDVHSIGWDTHIGAQTLTVAKWLKGAGYATGAVGKDHVMEVDGFRKLGWRDDPRDPGVKQALLKRAVAVKEAWRAAGFDYAERIYHNNPDGNGLRELAVHNHDWIVEGALDFIDQYHDQPFFLYMGSTLPHGPKEAGRSWNADPLATADGILNQAPRVLPGRETLRDRLARAGLPQKPSGGHDRENMLWLDDGVGALLAKLNEHQLENDTVIFYFNDHGQAAKGTVYQGGAHNPSVVWRKGGFKCGPINHAFVSNIDFAPTILDFANVPVPKNPFDGHSFKPILDGEVKSIRDTLYFEIGFTRAVRVGDWKYIALRYPKSALNLTYAQRKRRLDSWNAKQREHEKRTFTEDPNARFSHVSLIPGGGGAEHSSIDSYPAYHEADQLYYLPDDPDEQKNLAADPRHANKLHELQATLREYVAPLPTRFAEFSQ